MSRFFHHTGGSILNAYGVQVEPSDAEALVGIFSRLALTASHPEEIRASAQAAEELCRALGEQKQWLRCSEPVSSLKGRSDG